MTDEFVTFEEYAKVVKKSLEGIVHDYNMGDIDAVAVIYATPPVAFADFIQHTVNGQDPGPLVSFYLSGIEINSSEQLGGFKSLMIDNKYTMRAPIVAKLQYKITITAVKESQADLLQAQIVMAMPFNRPYATKLNGQWVTMEAKDFENESSVEIEADKDKVVTRTGTIEIARAYFDYPVQVNNKYIKSINSHIYSMEKKEKGELNENN